MPHLVWEKEPGVALLDCQVHVCVVGKGRLNTLQGMLDEEEIISRPRRTESLAEVHCRLETQVSGWRP